MAKQKSNQELIAEQSEIARSLGLDYGTYTAYCATGYIEQYRRMRFHEEIRKHENPNASYVPSNITKGAGNGI